MSPSSATQLKTALLLIDIQNAFTISTLLGQDRNNESLETNVKTLVDNVRQWNKLQNSNYISGNASLGDHASGMVDIIHVRHHSTDAGSPLHPSFTVLKDDNDNDEDEDESRDKDKGTSQSAPKKTRLREVRGVDAMPCAREIEGEAVVLKSVNSAFIGTKLEDHLRTRRIRQLIICGITTDHCVSTTTRMAANLKVVDSLDGTQRGQILVVGDACATFRRGEYDADLVHRVQLSSLDGEFAEVVDTRDVAECVLSPTATV